MLAQTGLDILLHGVHCRTASVGQSDTYLDAVIQDIDILQHTQIP